MLGEKVFPEVLKHLAPVLSDWTAPGWVEGEPTTLHDLGHVFHECTVCRNL